MSIEPILTDLEEALASHRPEVLETLQPAATASDLEMLTALSGSELPEDFLALMAWHAGQSALSNAQLLPGWRLQQPAEIASMLEPYTEMFDQGLFNHPAWWQPGWVPVFANDAGHMILRDDVGVLGGVAGQMLWVSMDDPERVILYPSLGDMLGRIAAAIRSGQEVVPPEGYPQSHQIPF